MRIRPAALVLTMLAPCVLVATRSEAQAPVPLGIASSQAPPTLVPAPVAPLVPVRERALGRSGSLRVAILRALDALDVVEPFAGPAGTEYRWVPLFGTRAPMLGTATPTSVIHAPDGPGTWRLEAVGPVSAGTPEGFTVIAPVPFSAKRAGYLNGYHIGTYPTEGSGRDDRYAPPPGFIEVTPQNRDLRISEHFRLGQFLTKDQFDVWPKYVALDSRLIDKLELVMQELNGMGVRADRYFVMSGYRTPQYNGPGGDGRAELSRHTYGDAADGWVDNDGNGLMDDLNGDGRIDLRDAEIILRAVDRVERKYPELVGGCGLYVATAEHGPFIHIDARGSRARW